MERECWSDRRWGVAGLVFLTLLSVGLAAFAVGLSVVAGIGSRTWSSLVGWLLLVSMLVAGAVAILLFSLLRTWRARLSKGEEEFRLLAENASDIVARVTLDGTLEWISPSVQTVLGWDPGSLTGTHPWDLVHPDDRGAAATSLGPAALPGTVLPRMNARFRKSDDSFAWLSAAARRAPDGRFIVNFRLVDDEVRAQQALRESEKRYRLLAENAMDMVLSLDMHAVVQWASPSVTALLGYEATELVGQFSGMLIVAEDLPLLLDAATDAREGRPGVCRIRMIAESGEEMWVEATPRGVYDDAGELVGGIVAIRDIQEEVQVRAALKHEVDFDALTGLSKRSGAIARIDEIRAARSGRGWALLCLGVDGLTAVNYAYTHAAGDTVLQAVADRLVRGAGAPERVARIAGDEFAILLRDVVTLTDAADAAERMLAAVRGPVVIGDAEVGVTACVGIALAGRENAEDLLRDATAAMRQASGNGTDRWEFLDGDIGESARQALAVHADLRDALDAGSIVPFFMPVANLADGVVSGYEALARWIFDDGSVRQPADFLPVAERTGLILTVDHTMLDQVLVALAAMPADTTVAVNVSAASLSSGKLVVAVLEGLGRVCVDPSRLHLEVTETDLLHVTDEVKGTMNALADVGVSWWVDDFGTGFSSITHLRDLPLTGLKLDRSFTAGITRDDSHATRLAMGLFGLANGLGLQTIAEGVETAEQAEVLVSQGWARGQGWLFGEAVPISQI